MRHVCILRNIMPVLLVNSDRYLGPAALLHATAGLSIRDEATGERLDDLEDHSNFTAAIRL